jgi:high-affinity iron transporter
MFAEFIITFRETFEAALVIGIMYSYLENTGNKEKKKYVNYGTVLGILLSIIGAVLFQYVLGGFEGIVEEIFEGILMLFGSLMITTLIIWFHRKSKTGSSLTQQLDNSIQKSENFGLFLLAFVSILREGIEVILFLGATALTTDGTSIIGALLGIIFALILGLLVYKGTIKLNIKKFFQYTAIFLIFVAAGLLAYGVHELQEVGIIPIIIEHVYDINHILDENGTFGSLLKGLFGYNGNPSLLEIIVYVLYIGSVFGIFFYSITKSKENTKDQVKSARKQDEVLV